MSMILTQYNVGRRKFPEGFSAETVRICSEVCVEKLREEFPEFKGLIRVSDELSSGDNLIYQTIDKVLRLKWQFWCAQAYAAKKGDQDKKETESARGWFGG